MGPLIREARPEERPDIARQWRKSFGVNSVEVDGAWYVYVGGAKILRALWIKAHRLLVEHLVEHDDVAVAVVDDEVIGWVCYGPNGVHFAWVIEPARKTDLEARLLAYADRPRRTHMSGRAA